MPDTNEASRAEPRGRWADPEPGWSSEEHARVFRALDDALGGVRFPATKGDVFERADYGATPIPLARYLEALPEKRYASAEDVKRELDERWRAARDLRGAGAAPNERAFPEGPR